MFKIEQISVYHPSTKRDNNYYIEHFSQKGKNVTPVLEKTGRKTRYIIENTEENSLTMAIKAAKKALSAAHIMAKDIDLIIFTSSTPEYLSPTNALMIHKAIEGKEDTLCFDLNGNCIGMFIALEQATRTLQTNPKMKRAMIIGSDFLNLLAYPEHLITYSIFGDAAVAMIIEKDISCLSGMIDVAYETNGDFKEEIVYPAHGMAKSLRQQAEHDYLYWGHFSGRDSLKFAEKSIRAMLNKHGLLLDDIKAFCLSQFTLANIKLIQESLHLQDKQIVYIGDQYGYTGTSSPFLALYTAIEAKQIQRGDYIVFWTLGSGYQTGTLLWRY
ncbi:ketoacyl-ACP synthase III [Bacillus aquiflavi]|uniref:Ketoacyl-ACP synthase III n=1 Tax=Bacillus aquiflavi TaxID=2672567 RepID=A0A6B3VYD5_9BACI|nr:3-oxoacyl-[acyl-carrier-protein] synthase III C-terminal domain-containing protein [Bacillus aquiflavi]MBA4536173.1 ketoacyl-ACP synthase III [Bacillus aquiflavi]NEY80546.1 ketoacyl-ACP synthase III [Bacillus aquiflavi]